ncbi:MAG TPA: ATP-grasp domain-containing protein, partial [Albitalea sp.]
MRRVFVYEFLSGGGEPGAGADAADLRAAGVAMRDAIVADLRTLPGVAVTCAASAAAPAPAGVPSATPQRGEPATAFVRRLAARHDHAWVVAPETGGVLAALHEAVGPARWVGCRGDAIGVASSKRATLLALSAHGVATPLAFGGATRWVVKPDDGAGAGDTRVHADAAAAQADLARRRAAGRCATLEPWVEGEALSISLLAAGDGTVEAVAFNRQDVSVDADGTLAWHGVRHHAIDPVRDARAPRLHALAAAAG